MLDEIVSRIKEKIEKEVVYANRSVFPDFIFQIRDRKNTSLILKTKDIIKSVVAEEVKRDGRSIVEEYCLDLTVLDLGASCGVFTFDIKDDDPRDLLNAVERKLAVKYGYINKGSEIKVLDKEFDERDYDIIFSVYIEAMLWFRGKLYPYTKDTMQIGARVTYGLWINPHPEDDLWPEEWL